MSHTKKASLELLLIGGPSVAMFLSNVLFLLLQLLLLVICLLVRNILACHSVQNTQRCTVWGESCGEGFASFVAWFLSCSGNHEQGDWRVSFQPTASSWTNGPNYIQGKWSTLHLLSRALKVSVSSNSFILLVTFKTGTFLILRLFWSSVANDVFLILHSHLFFNGNRWTMVDLAPNVSVLVTPKPRVEFCCSPV